MTNGSPQSSHWYDDRLIRWIVGLGVALVLLHIALWLLVSPDQVIGIFPWFIPAVVGFLVLASISIAFLSFGRYRVIPQPAAFWVSIAFVSYAIFNVFVLLSFPGLLPDQGGLIARLPNTSAWLSFVNIAFLVLALHIAISFQWPRGGESTRAYTSWLWIAVAFIVTLIGILSVRFEEDLPLLIIDGAFTPVYLAELALATFLSALGALMSTIRYARTGDRLFGYLAMTELFLAFAFFDDATAQVRFNLLWYLGSLLTIPALATILFGLLSQYIDLYRRERQNARDLEDERNRLRVVLDTTPVGIALYLAPDGHVQIFNKAYERIIGRPAVLNKSAVEIAAAHQVTKPNGRTFSPDEMPVCRSLLGETVTATDMQVTHPDGRKVFFQVNSAPLFDSRHNVIGAVASLQDVTSVKEQEQLRDEFLSAAAHELKTPVATIKGYAQLLRRWKPEERQAREPQAIEIINTQTDRINRRVQEMLEVVRFRKAPPELRTEPFDLANLVAETVQRVQSMTPGIHLTLKRDGPAPVNADRERIEEVIISLLDNAIKYSPANETVEVLVSTTPTDALISIRDHGVGISKERQPHVFEPFYEAVPSGAPGYRGTVALSLYLSKLNIELNSGKIWFESEEGKGSTFYFTLPLTPR